MEKGLKNLNQAYRAACKKQGTYDGSHDDSGIGHSDMDEDEPLPDLPESAAGNAYQPPPPHQHQQHFPVLPQQRMGPSINNLIDQHPSYQTHQAPLYGAQL